MFIGHYAPGILGASSGKIKLWQAFIGVQLVDYAWAGLNLAGIEKTRVIPGFTEASPLDLYYMPYTHSLGMAIIWAVGAALIFGLIFRKQAKVGAVIFGLVVLSHWFLDLVSHVPDLPLWFGTEKYGFGLWNYGTFNFILEIILVVGAMLYYLKKSVATGKFGRIYPYVFIAILIGIQTIGHFSEPPATVNQFAVTALISYSVLALAAWGVDKTRSFKT